MLLDYSEVLSRLIIFLGAGMSIRSAWERIAVDYRRSVEHGVHQKRYIYEENGSDGEPVKSGVSESQAFYEFGSRCGLQPYMKLAALLEQSRKNGAKLKGNGCAWKWQMPLNSANIRPDGWGGKPERDF